MPNFDAKSMQRISKAVRDVERRLRGRRQKRARWHGRSGVGGNVHHWGTLAGNLDTGGTADVTITGGTLSDVKAPPVMAADRRFETGTAVGVTLFSDGDWYVTWAHCTSIEIP